MSSLLLKVTLSSVIVNLIVCFWFVVFEKTETGVVDGSVQGRGVKQIVLVGELADFEQAQLMPLQEVRLNGARLPERRVSVEKWAVAFDGDEAGMDCMRFGGLNKNKDAVALLKKLGALAGATGRVSPETEGLVRYLVYLPPFSSSVEARRVRGRLARQGVQSSLYYEEGFKNALSLGYFVSRSEAEHKQQEALSAGYRGLVEPVATVVTRYWLVFRKNEFLKLSDRFWQDAELFFPWAIRERVSCE